MTGIERDEPDIQPLQPEQDWLSPDLPWGTDPVAPAEANHAAPPDPAWVAEPAPAPAPPVPKRPLWRPIGALLCFAAAILTLFGSFLDLFSTHIGNPGGDGIVLTITGWTVRITNNGIPESDVPAGLAATNGPPLVFAAAALLAAAVLGLLVAAAPGSTLFARIGSLTAMGATAFLAGTTWTITMEQLSLLDRFRPATAANGRPPFEYAPAFDLGYWLLLTANAAAIAGVVFALLPLTGRLRLRLRRRSEPDTPPMGIPMPVVVHRLPDAPADEPD